MGDYFGPDAIRPDSWRRLETGPGVELQTPASSAEALDQLVRSALESAGYPPVKVAHTDPGLWVGERDVRRDTVYLWRVRLTAIGILGGGVAAAILIRVDLASTLAGNRDLILAYLGFFCFVLGGASAGLFMGDRFRSDVTRIVASFPALERTHGGLVRLQIWRGFVISANRQSRAPGRAAIRAFANPVDDRSVSAFRNAIAERPVARS